MCEASGGRGQVTRVVTARFTIHPRLGSQESLSLPASSVAVPSLTRAATSASSAKLQPKRGGAASGQQVSVTWGAPSRTHYHLPRPQSVPATVLEGQP